MVYGVIVGASYRAGEHYAKLQIRNEHTIRSLKRDEDWPWVDLSIFSLPGPYPLGTYRRQIIHFGLSIKDDPNDELESWWNTWLEKFEDVLRRLFWTSARLHIERDFEPRRREYGWSPTDKALAAMYDELPEPVATWERSMQAMPGEKLGGT